MLEPLAIWSTARDAWETPGQEGLLCEHSVVYSGTWPASGMTRSGTAYALPTSGPVTPDSGSLCLPPPPTTQDAANIGGQSQASRHSPGLHHVVLSMA